MALRTVAFILVCVAAVQVPTCQGTESIAVLTFNAGLSGGTNITAFSDERRTAQLNAITADGGTWQTSDVACVQEVPVDTDRQEYVRRAKNAGFNYSFAGVVETADDLTGKTACSIVATTAALCILTHCKDATSVDDALPCILDTCKKQAGHVQQTCINCIAGGTGPLLSIFTKCLQSPAKEYTTNLGLMVLSKKEIVSSKIVAFGKSSNPFRRGYIQAEIKDVGTLFCTHLYPNFENYPKLKSTFAEENLAQMKELVDTASALNSIIAGDMNCGPENKHNRILPLFPQSCSYPASKGFSDPYSQSPASNCTFCADNPVNVASTKPVESSILDHIFVNPNVFSTKKPERVFTRNVVKVGSLLMPLSDHYGVQMQVQRVGSVEKTTSTSMASRPLASAILAYVVVTAMTVAASQTLL